MKSYTLIWALLLWLPFQMSSQNANYRLEVEVLVAEENRNLFIPLQTYSYSLAPQAFRQNIVLPATAGRIRLQMYLMSATSKVDIYDLLINGLKSSDQESFVIEDPMTWMQRGEPLMIVLADKPYSYYKLDVPIQWSNANARSAMPQSFDYAPATATSATTPAGYSRSYVAPGLTIQIEARKDLPNLYQFTALQSFGTVYYREDPSWYRVRLGTFTSQTEAREKLNAIKKVQNGAFARAYLTSEEGGYVVMLPGTQVAASSIPQGYGDATGARINTDPNLTARGAMPAQPVPPSYDAPGQPAPANRPQTLAERAPKFPDWYYNSATAVTAPEPGPTSYDALLNSPLPKSYDATGTLTPKGVPQSGFYVQTGAYGNFENAQRNYQRLVDQGITNAQVMEVRKPNGQVIYRTLVGPYRTQATAKNQQELMARNMKIAGTVVSGDQ